MHREDLQMEVTNNIVDTANSINSDNNVETAENMIASVTESIAQIEEKTKAMPLLTYSKPEELCTDMLNSIKPVDFNGLADNPKGKASMEDKIVTCVDQLLEQPLFWLIFQEYKQEFLLDLSMLHELICQAKNHQNLISRHQFHHRHKEKKHQACYQHDGNIVFQIYFVAIDIYGHKYLGNYFLDNNTLLPRWDIVQNRHLS